MPWPPLSAGVGLTLSCTQTCSYTEICTLIVHPALLCKHFVLYAHVVVSSRMHITCKDNFFIGVPGFLFTHLLSHSCLYLCFSPKSGLQVCGGLCAAHLTLFLPLSVQRAEGRFLMTHLYMRRQGLNSTSKFYFIKECQPQLILNVKICFCLLVLQHSFVLGSSSNVK